MTSVGERHDDVQQQVTAFWSMVAPDYEAHAGNVPAPGTPLHRAWVEVVALHAAGWRDHGSGLLDPVVDALHRLRPRGADITDTRLAVAALHEAVALESLYGAAFRRSAGLTGADASASTAQLRWWTRQLELGLGLTPRRRST